MDQTMTVYPALKFFLVSGLEALAFLLVTVYALSRIRRGVANVLGVLSGVIGVASAGTYVVAWAQVQWRDSFGIFDYISTNDLLQHLDWARAIAVALLAAAFLVSTRTSAA